MAGKREINIPAIVAIIMLFMGILPVSPFVYYRILRIVICIIACYFVWIAHCEKKEGWIWAMLLVAIFFNPFVMAHLEGILGIAMTIAAIIILAKFKGDFNYLQPKRKTKKTSE